MTCSLFYLKYLINVLLAKVSDTDLLVAQNRVDNIISLEFPSGYIESGESYIKASSRELLDETGYITDSLYFMDSYYSQLGIDSSISLSE